MHRERREMIKVLINFVCKLAITKNELVKKFNNNDAILRVFQNESYPMGKQYAEAPYAADKRRVYRSPTGNRGGGRGGYTGSFVANYDGGYYRSYRRPPRLVDEEKGDGEDGSRGCRHPKRFSVEISGEAEMKVEDLVRQDEQSEDEVELLGIRG
ncbi:hypothetical protein FQA39_LY05225 [Lamprigera yunnana]|nr:hypothetical protein FQA39_LY05225 [Lamprigera yunnana]